jgi:hypothetical protein
VNMRDGLQHEDANFVNETIRSADESRLGGILMQNILLAGTAGVFLAVGAASAANPNVPSWSPYAIMGFDSAAPTSNPGPRADEMARVEGRAAYVDPSYRHFKPGYDYAADPAPSYDDNRFPGFGDTGSQFGPD